MFAASKTDGSGLSVDPQFNYVTMLLHGDGTNGAQNNTFVDSSTNNFAITRNGNTTQGSFTPYGSNWSNFFNGTSDNLSLPSNAAFAFGTGDFTVEGWFYQTADNTYPSALEIGAHINASGIIFITKYGGNAAIYSGGFYGGTAPTTLNAWNHIAWVRSSGVLKIYVNGVNTTSEAFTNNLTVTSNITIGSSGSLGTGPYFFSGNMSNLRAVKGTAVYTANFTPSTAPLTAISGTSLLTCQSNRFVDTSTIASAIGITGTPSVQRFNPFGTSTAYSTSVIGGSGYFDGSGDYLVSASTSAMNLAANNFSIEMWFYATSTSGTYNGLCGSQTDYKGPSISRFGSVLMYGLSSNGSSWNVLQAESSTGTTTIKANQWYHVVLCRTGTTISAFVNGARDITITSSASIFARTEGFTIGAWFAGLYIWLGYISGFRFVVGSSPYDATQTTITVPTSPPTAITNTQLLTNFTNGAIFDNAMMNDLETVGNAQISTSVVKYGTGSLAFDGTGDYLNSTNSLLAIQGSIAFTLEAWIYPTSVAGDFCIYETRGGSGFVFFINSGGKLQVYDSVALSQTQSTTTLTANTWTFISLVRVAGSSTVTYYVNGTSAGTFSLSSFATATRTRIGAREDAIAAYVGYIDDFRITIGYARYTANFTPPTAAFSNTGPY